MTVGPVLAVSGEKVSSLRTGRADRFALGSHAHIFPASSAHRTGLAVITLPPNAADLLGYQSRLPRIRGVGAD